MVSNNSHLIYLLYLWSLIIKKTNTVSLKLFWRYFEKKKKKTCAVYEILPVSIEKNTTECHLSRWQIQFYIWRRRYKNDDGKNVTMSTCSSLGCVSFKNKARFSLCLYVQFITIKNFVPFIIKKTFYITWGCNNPSDMKIIWFIFSSM